MELRHLRYAVELGRTMHFTQAAERLGVAQPALSQAIAALEKELAVSLFTRTSRRVHPTAAGILFLERAGRILDEVASLNANMQEHASSVRGRVTLGTMVYFGETRLPSVIAAFAHEYPGIDIVLDNRSTHDSIEGLRSGRFDVALLNISDSATYPDLEIVAVEQDEIAIALPPGHPLSTRRGLTFDQLKDDLFVAYEPGSTMYETLQALIRQGGFTPRAVVHCRNIMLVRAMVAEGMGVSIGPRSYLTSPGPVIAVRSLTPRIAVSISMVIGATIQGNPAARALVDFLRNYFAPTTLTAAVTELLGKPTLAD
jgi:DNA-binding transcriptional LysR family regulator